MRWLRRLRRYWGYLALIIAIGGLVTDKIGLAVILILSVTVLGYFLLQAPVWCGAVTRDGTLCRNNSWGHCRLRTTKPMASM